MKALQFSFSQRPHTTQANAETKIEKLAEHIFSRSGAMNIISLAQDTGMSLRNFERLFVAEFGLSPKKFARIARFQNALDTAASPGKKWREIAYEFEYFDRTHMVRDFISPGGRSPSRVLALLGDMRPKALTGRESASSADPVHLELID